MNQHELTQHGFRRGGDGHRGRFEIEIHDVEAVAFVSSLEALDDFALRVPCCWH